MDTKQSIINLADELIRCKGYNAFSYHDISKKIGIKTASIHYHFPLKSDLGVSVIKDHQRKLKEVMLNLAKKDPVKKLEAFFSIYSNTQAQNGVCLVGSLATDLNTMDEPVKTELKIFAAMVLEWVTEIMQQGRKEGVFSFTVTPRAKAILIITNMLAVVQLSRLTSKKDFDLVKRTIIKELKTITK